MAEIEDAIADGVIDALDVGTPSPPSAGFVPLHGTGEVGSIHASSATTPMDTGPNAGSGTRPMAAGFLGIADNPDYERHVAEAKAAHAAADLSLRLFREAFAPVGTVPGLATTERTTR